MIFQVADGEGDEQRVAAVRAGDFLAQPVGLERGAGAASGTGNGQVLVPVARRFLGAKFPKKIAFYIKTSRMYPL